MFWKGDNFRESNQEKKQRPDTKNRRLIIKSDNFTSNREKSNIPFAILEK